ncbi:helix-turn-helix transcriptional regulator [Clostridiaceae bacterium NSJ-31]|uniref:Helix-turn-helix transcriptional regulator n=1 Tax=Ligaoa zhengdingensis TaxID=2763658 RepID=A0A926DWV2_9FIRM|nr:helix-turn-helix transcriptional regulator [Ligaoa zhengdingensis]MBC8545353.1 helix-turn-helix transcriptional regulator [Ligaoa zhengdingensis]
MNMSIPGKFSDIIYQKRISIQMTQKTVAELSDISTRHYQDVEMGRVNPSLSVAIRIAAVLDVGLDSLKSEV